MFRYQGDTYDGGNPWVLLTAGLAQLLYRASIYSLEHASDSTYPASAEALKMWQSALSLANPLPSNDAAALAEAFAAAGDGVLLRLREHVSANNWILFEQLDEKTGSLIL